MDILTPESWFYEPYLTYTKSPAFNAQFESNGYETSHMSYNLGSFVLFFIFYPVKAVVLSILRWIFKKFCRFEVVRKIGMRLESIPLK